jgi:hypothetical protein
MTIEIDFIEACLFIWLFLTLRLESLYQKLQPLG